MWIHPSWRSLVLVLISVAWTNCQTSTQDEELLETSSYLNKKISALDDVTLNQQCNGTACEAWMKDPANPSTSVRAGDDAILTCMVQGARGEAVVWRRVNDKKILTAAKVRIVDDDRVYVLHDDADDLPTSGIAKGGEVWALVIKNVKLSDSGYYACELQTTPPLKSFHRLTVITSNLTPPDSTNITDSYSSNATPISSLASLHNYTDCCLLANVTKSCLGFCSIQTILEGTAQDPEMCQPDFPAIVKCMADGRNHVPCCISERVPDICQDVCRGEFTPVTDLIKTHYSCSHFMEKTLACIVEGIELLPSPPENVDVVVLNEHQLNISWDKPLSNSQLIIQYLINVTTLQNFDANVEEPLETDPGDPSTWNSNQFYNMIIKVPSNMTSVIVNDLKPYTMYEVKVTAYNIHGSSLPSVALRTLTLTPTIRKPTEIATAPQLPDVKSCCVKAGINHYGCIEKLCDPLKTVEIGITDLVICAPWAPDTFKCLANGIDHSPCCRARGLPATCLPLCYGNVTSIDFNHFKCLRYMAEYTSCLLQGYGVVPGPPTNVRVSNIDTSYAAVHWSAPKTLNDTVQYYNLNYRKLEIGVDSDYYVIPKVHPPVILHDLESNTDYEVYVEAVNGHGLSEGSPRLIFRTESQVVASELEDAANSVYNVSACCSRAGVSPVCQPLCTYDAKMSDLRTLLPLCTHEVSKLLRCGAAGRNHEPCCARRGVLASCLPVCSGVVPPLGLGTLNTCVAYIGNVVQCFEEGSGKLPGQPRELHAVTVTNTSVELQWASPIEGPSPTSYIVHYEVVENTTAPNYYNALSNQRVVNGTSITLSNLESAKTYQIFIVSSNDEGTSLPSSLLLINITQTDLGDGVSSKPSAPHSLGVSGHSANWVTVSWQPPHLSLHDDRIIYHLYYKATGASNYTIIETSITSHSIDELTPNTQYIIYVVAILNNNQTSDPSETLVAWTDPAYPAYVEPPIVNPINLVVEGGSMTILCIAMGTPTPIVSLYISGRLVRQETTRHMVTVIHNVTRDMTQISCYADNGYGTAMQASRKINISHPPTIQASGITMAAAGDSVTLECRVEALPKPQIAFWRDPQGRKPVIDGPKYTTELIQDTEESSKYTMRLTISKISEPDEGDYFCHAENAYGPAIRPVSVRLRASPHRNMSVCCIQEGVSPGCIDACSFNLDLDNVLERRECDDDLSKLMKCAADGSDHRACCASWGVPRSCLEICRGGSASSVCVTSHGRRALACFRDAGASLPGPPRALTAHPVPKPRAVLLSWEPPTKNPQTVYLYRVFWRPLGARLPEKLDTSETSVVITNLEEGVTYECVVKAANDVGTSSLAGPVQFTAGGVVSGGGSGALGAALAAVAFAAAAGVAAFLYYRHRRNLKAKTQGGVAFENPSYLREPNPDTVINGNTPAVDSSNRPNGNQNGSVSNSTGWRQELQPVGAQEVNPTLYEELKLGHDGAGFKRLK